MCGGGRFVTFGQAWRHRHRHPHIRGAVRLLDGDLARRLGGGSAALVQLQRGEVHMLVARTLESALAKTKTGEVRKLEDALKATRDELSTCRLERDRARQTSDTLKERMDAAQRALAETLSSLGSLEGEKRTLGEQLHELLYKHRVALAAVEHARRELDTSTQWMEAAMRQAEKRSRAAVAGAELRVAQVQRDSRHERELLVQAALQSLAQLRTHLATTLSGLRSALPLRPQDGGALVAAEEPQAACAAAAPQSDAGGAPPAAGLALKRFEVVDERGETVAVRFEPPRPPLQVKPLPPSPRQPMRPVSASARTHHRSALVRLSTPPGPAETVIAPSSKRYHARLNSARTAVQSAEVAHAGAGISFDRGYII